MKKYLLYLTTAFLTAHLAAAQVLYTEDFDNLTVGNIGTDITGTIPGQGGWLTFGSSVTSLNTWFRIETETNRGKVATLKAPVYPNATGNTALIKKVDHFIKSRSQGNNVIAIEADVYVGPQITYKIPRRESFLSFGVRVTTNNNIPRHYLAYVTFHLEKGTLNFRSFTGQSGSLGFSDTFIYNSWMTFRIYLDYDNKKAYFNSPTLNIYNLEVDFLNLSTLPNLFDDFTFDEIILATAVTNDTQVTYKLDNIKITALNKVPLNISEFLNEKIQVFPNPASNIVHITNSIDVTIEEINIYDVTGKLIKTEKTASTENMVLNIEDLTSGSYLIHIKTSQGTAVKKMIKK